MSRDEEFELFKLRMKETRIDYFTEELKINSDALKFYDHTGPIPDATAEVQKMRETQAIVLRDRVNELSRHIALIKRML